MMNVTIDVTTIVFLLILFGLILLVWKMYRDRDFRQGIFTIIQIGFLISLITVPIYVMISDVKSKEIYKELLPESEQDLYGFVTFYEKLTFKTVPYKELKDRQKEKNSIKENYIKGE